jgi:hypothetical protein
MIEPLINTEKVDAVDGRADIDRGPPAVRKQAEEYINTRKSCEQMNNTSNYVFIRLRVTLVPETVYFLELPASPPRHSHTTC